MAGDGTRDLPPLPESPPPEAIHLDDLPSGSAPKQTSAGVGEPPLTRERGMPAWAVVAMIVVAFTASLTVVVLLRGGGGDDGRPAAVTEAPRVPEQADSVGASPLAGAGTGGDPPTVEQVRSAIGCTGSCPLTGTIEFEHPTWGPSVLATVGTASDTSCDDVAMYAVEPSGTVVWSREFGSCWYELAPAAPEPDANGHLFVTYNPGRYDGVIVLAPAPEGFDDFGTLPPYGEYDVRFYFAEVLDVDGGGGLEIEHFDNDCTPSCAGGAITSIVYSWDGSDYRPR